ncbi:MAG TPA: hypothetical protein VND64_32195 [Pirellulales bacterium]|nr:hypothetical protein [Pirellulales bacterium]
MKWKKLGLVFCADGHAPWMHSHAANPVAEHLDGDCFRVYFGCRDRLNRSSIGYVDVEIGDVPKVTAVAERALVSPGDPGTFDDSGTSVGCLVTVGAQRLLYYLGWNLGVTVPWRNSIGLAVSDTAGAEFRKASRAPMMDRNDVDPFTLSYPWVLRDAGLFRMWYGSHLCWGPGALECHDMHHVIKYAESQDGTHWTRNDVVAIDVELPGRYAVCRPCVLRDGEIYRMWLCHRGAAYRIGYAESRDGIRWEWRDDLAGLDLSPTGWDSEMLAYPCVFDHHGHRYMLYNGNGYGRTGFGLAVLDQGT